VLEALVLCCGEFGVELFLLGICGVLLSIA
jgi:hypothetical protein